MFSDFPNLHPLVVHVPVVLIVLSAALQVLLVVKDWPPVRWVTLGIMGGGFAGAVAASTYFHAMPMGLPPKAAAIFASHEQYAGYTLWLSGITLLLRGVGEFFKLQRRAYEILVLGFALASAGALSVAGHRGAQLVYVEGVGPQGHLVMKGHHHDEGDAATMPGMAMPAGGHDEQAWADDHPESTAPTAAEQQSTAEKPHSSDMPGMDMSSTETQKTTTASGKMGNMDRTGSKPTGQAKPAARPAAMADMPGMKMPASKSPQKMPEGMSLASPKPRNKMPAMNDSPTRAKNPNKAQSEMGGMQDMPSMKSLPSAQPAPAMGTMNDMPGMKKGQAMPAMGLMPGMTMPNPLDKFRFKDNNPARNQPTPIK